MCACIVVYVQFLLSPGHWSLSMLRFRVFLKSVTLNIVSLLFLPECACTTIIGTSPWIFSLMYCCCVSIIFVNCICPPGALIWLINLFLFLSNCIFVTYTIFESELSFLLTSSSFNSCLMYRAVPLIPFHPGSCTEQSRSFLSTLGHLYKKVLTMHL